MPTRVKQLPIFGRQLKRLERKYPGTLQTVLTLVDSLEQGKRPGEMILGAGYNIYKARLPSAAFGKGA